MTVKDRDIVRFSLTSAKIHRGRTDAKRVRETTDAAIEADIGRDADLAPLLDEDWFAQANAVQPAQKVSISIRVDPDVLEFFRQSGPGYQTRMNAVLRAFVERAKHK